MKINDIDYEVGIYDLEGNFIDSTDDLDILKKDFDLTELMIRNYLNSNASIIKNYQLKFIKTNLKTSKFLTKIGNVVGLDKMNTGKPVAKFYKGKLISVYKTLTEAETKTKISRWLISTSCSTGNKAGIFNFKYI